MLGLRRFAGSRVRAAGRRIVIDDWRATNLAQRSWLSSEKKEDSNADFQETLRRIKNEAEARSKEAAGGEAATDAQQPPPEPPQSPQVDYVAKAREWLSFAREYVGEAYDEMRGTKKTSLSRTVQQAASFKKASKAEGDAAVADGDEEAAEEAAKPSGPSALVLVKEPVSQWERMKQRLEGSRVIREMLKNAKQFQSAAAKTDLGQQAQKMGQSLKDKLEDAREFYETSQSPLMYKVAGFISDMTAQTEEGNAITAIMKLDPSFDKEEWAAEVKRSLIPTIIKAHLVGDTKVLKPWLGEAVYNKLAADIRIRKQEGITFDDKILELDEAQILMNFHEQEPIIIASYAVQLINCIKDKKGDIIEGRPDAIVMRFYSMAFQQVFDEDQGTVSWKIIDYQMGKDEAWL
jgi:import inner membrane translocase subunit TIM44